MIVLTDKQIKILNDIIRLKGSCLLVENKPKLNLCTDCIFFNECRKLMWENNMPTVKTRYNAAAKALLENSLFGYITEDIKSIVNNSGSDT